MNQSIQGGNGIQVSGDASGFLAGGDIHYTAASDGYTQMEMARKGTTRAWLPDNWLSVAAAVAGVLGLCLNTKWPTSWAPSLTLVFIAMTAGGAAAILLRQQLAATSCVPVWGWVVELGADDKVYLSEAVGTCPRCGNKMHLERVKGDDDQSYYIWNCASGVPMHNLRFDPTEFYKGAVAYDA